VTREIRMYSQGLGLCHNCGADNVPVSYVGKRHGLKKFYCRLCVARSGLKIKREPTSEK
jgi:hypothetical protein